MKIVEKEVRFANGRTLLHRSIVSASFEEWIAHLFDRPDCEFGSHWSSSEEIPAWELPLETTSGYIARTFAYPEMWAGHFSKAQIAAGLVFIWNPVYGDVFSAMGEKVSPELQMQIIHSLVPLYEQCFARLCEQGLSHLDECGDNPLNVACYMFWEICPLDARSEEASFRERDMLCLEVMKSTLKIEHEACRESALHGIGHWQGDYPERVKSIIVDFLSRHRNPLRPELARYAEAASRGCVL
jgi:hypothetical protein